MNVVVAGQPGTSRDIFFGWNNGIGNRAVDSTRSNATRQQEGV